MAGGLSNENSQSKVFLNIFKGQFAQKVEADTKGAISRVNKNDVTVHELLYNALEGKLLYLEEKVHEEYGTFWKITLEHEGILYMFDVKQDSGYSYGFMYRIESCDLAKPIRFKPYYIEDKEVEGKWRAFMVLYQDGNKIESNYTQENKNGLPDLVEHKVGNKVLWDSTDRIVFLKNMLRTQVLPELPGVPESAPAPEVSTQEQVTAPALQEPEAPNDDDDLPF